MRVEPDGAEGQEEARRHFQPAPEWAAQDEESAWVIVRAEMVAGLDHCEVGLGPKRVADSFMEIEAYEKRGDSYRSEDQRDEDLDDLVAGLETLRAGAVNLQESIRKALLKAVEGRCFMQQVLELGANEGEPDELALEGCKQEVFAFVRRVAGSASGGPEAEAKGNLALLALVVEDILSQAAEWQTSLADMLALQNQREQGACADLCSGGAEAAGLGRVAAGNGGWRLVDGRWQTEHEGG
jgi:hypothetical protein